jgi:tetratricopeptide (TPR) repeat protein
LVNLLQIHYHNYIMHKLPKYLFLIVFLMLGGKLFAQTIYIDEYQKAANGYYEAKNYQAAYENYTKAISKNKNDNDNLSTLYYLRGVCLTELNRVDEAIKDFTTVIAIKPIPYAYWQRGTDYESKNKLDLAIIDYKNAIALMPNENANNSILYCSIANDEMILGKYSEALKADSISLTLDNQSSRAYIIMSNIHLGLKKYDLAIEDITKAIFSLKEYNAEDVSMLYVNRADMEQRIKKYKDAINDYTLAISKYPDNKVAYWNRAATYHYNSDYELATDDYTKAMTFYKNDNTNLSRLYDNRALNEIRQSLYEKAIQDDSTAIVLDAANKTAYFDLADAYTQSADYQQGINAFIKLKYLFKDNKKVLALLYYEIANNEYFLNEFDKVVADCSKAIELDPDYAASYYYRGKVYLKKMNDKQSALNDFNKVIQLDTTKKTVDYIFSLFYTGKGDEAAAILQDNLLTTTDNALMLSDYYNLACIYSLMNRPDEANIYLKKAIDGGYAKKYAIADEDLNNIRNTDDYKTTMGIGKSQ